MQEAISKYTALEVLRVGGPEGGENQQDPWTSLLDGFNLAGEVSGVGPEGWWCDLRVGGWGLGGFRVVGVILGLVGGDSNWWV